MDAQRHPQQHLIQNDRTSYFCGYMLHSSTISVIESIYEFHTQKMVESWHMQIYSCKGVQTYIRLI